MLQFELPRSAIIKFATIADVTEHVSKQLEHTPHDLNDLLSEMGRLDVMIIEASNLPDKAIVGTQDCFVRVAVNNQSFDTSVARATVNPKYAETFKFLASDPDSDCVRITVMAKGPISDDFLGEYKCTLSGLTRGERKEYNAILENCKTNATIRFALLALDFGAEPARLDDDDDLVPVTGTIVDGTGRKNFGRKDEPAVPLPPAPPAVLVAAPPPPMFQQPQWASAADTGGATASYKLNDVEKLARDVNKKLNSVFGIGK